MLLDSMGHGLLISIFEIIMFAVKWNVYATFYTNCFTTEFVSYVNEPIFVSQCKSLLRGATLCSNDINCNLFSTNGSQCAFFTKQNSSIKCERVTSEYSMMVTFRPCKYWLIVFFYFTSDVLFSWCFVYYYILIFFSCCHVFVPRSWRSFSRSWYFPLNFALILWNPVKNMNLCKYFLIKLTHIQTMFLPIRFNKLFLNEDSNKIFF